MEQGQTSGVSYSVLSLFNTCGRKVGWWGVGGAGDNTTTGWFELGGSACS